MSTGIRQKLGVALVVASIVSAIIVVVATENSGGARVVSHRDLGSVHETVVVVDVNVRWLAPSVSLLVVGLAFLAWRARKPPRLIP